MPDTRSRGNGLDRAFQAQAKHIRRSQFTAHRLDIINTDLRIGARFLFSSYNMLPTAHNNHSAIMKRAEKAEAAMAEYVKHYPNGAFPVPSHYAHPIVLKQMADAIEEGRAVTVPEALTAVENRLKSLNADVQVEQEEYDEVVVIKAMFLNHDYQ